MIRYGVRSTRRSGMPDPEAPPRLIRFVRRALRVEPTSSFEDVLARWRADFGNDVGTELIREVYDDELARASQPRPRDPRHGQVVLTTVAIWLVLNVGIALALGLPEYGTCKQSGSSGAGFSACGFAFGATFLVVGVVQLVYGAVVSVVAYRARAAAGQGILIGMGITTVLFTVVCFGATTTG